MNCQKKRPFRKHSFGLFDRYLWKCVTFVRDIFDPPTILKKMFRITLNSWDYRTRRFVASSVTFSLVLRKMRFTALIYYKKIHTKIGDALDLPKQTTSSCYLRLINGSQMLCLHLNSRRTSYRQMHIFIT